MYDNYNYSLDGAHISLAMPPSHDDNIIYFPRLCLEDALSVLALRNEYEIRRHMYNTAIITLESHLAFVRKKDAKQAYYAFKYEGRVFGVGSLSRISRAHKHAYLGIYRAMEGELCAKKPFAMGALILSSIEGIARDMGLERIFLEVSEKNTRAHEFYERHGYIKQGCLENYLLVSRAINAPLVNNTFLLGERIMGFGSELGGLVTGDLSDLSKPGAPNDSSDLNNPSQPGDLSKPGGLKEPNALASLHIEPLQVEKELINVLVYKKELVCR